MAMVDPQPTLVERLIRHVLLPREPLPQIETNSSVVTSREIARESLLSNETSARECNVHGPPSPS